ncbi:MAG: ATP-dependent DNA ligase [Burkholderiaceae bacterium]|nr:ATP-dependent DNA ligase [Burkholderiaceae bacterium]
MRRFAQLYQSLDASTATNDKLAALQAYFAAAPADDAAWAVYFLAGGKPRQVVPTALMRETACAMAGIDDWLFEACYQAVGDLAETIAHVLPPPSGAVDDAGLAEWVEQRLLPLRGLPPAEQAARLRQAWSVLDPTGRFLLVKLIGGGFRVGVSKLLVTRALAAVAGLDAKQVAQRLMGWTDAKRQPTAERYRALLDPQATPQAEAGQPYPFFLAHPLQAEPQSLGDAGEWIAEWKYDGIRAQVVRRAGQCWIWSRGEELMAGRFPEIEAWAQALPDGTVLDGEVLVWLDGAPKPAPFNLLQQRITRKTLPKTLLAKAPVRFLAYDLLESDGEDRRTEPQHQRRARLGALLSARDVSPRVPGSDWPALTAARAESRTRGVEGLMLKHRDAVYGQGRTKADGATSAWWKWKVDPLTADAVLVYAQAGHGRRASVYTDYTFAVWNRPPHDAAEAQAVVDAIARREPAPRDDPQALQLVPFAKAYSGLTDAEFAAVDKVIRATTLEKFGPVRSVRPTLVFELGFEGIGPSPRHKSGIAVRFPRMLRVRHDKPLHEADTLPTLRTLSLP